MTKRITLTVFTVWFCGMGYLAYTHKPATYTGAWFRCREQPPPKRVLEIAASTMKPLYINGKEIVVVSRESRAQSHAWARELSNVHE